MIECYTCGDQRGAYHIGQNRTTRSPRWHRWQSSFESAIDNVLDAEGRDRNRKKAGTPLDQVVHKLAVYTGTAVFLAGLKNGVFTIFAVTF